MDQRAIDTLAWLDLNGTPPGEGFAEVEILRQLTEGAPASGHNILAEAYRLDIARGISGSNRVEAREVAHHIMFASDFGRRSVSVPSSGETLDAMIIAHQSDTDTLGELLISALIIGHESQVVTDATAVFNPDWDALSRSNFAADYHAVLVGGIYYALADL